jgi:hypothetical protein
MKTRTWTDWAVIGAACGVGAGLAVFGLWLLVMSSTTIAAVEAGRLAC